MRTPQQPFNGDPPPGDGAPSYEWLDEWLCEYVDGTMDPSLEVVFEKYVEANPDLRAHVKRLRQTRELLCDCEFSEEPSQRTQAEVCSEVEEDLLQSSESLSVAMRQRPLAVAGLASSVLVALVVGFLAGSMTAGLSPVGPSSPPVAEQEVSEREGRRGGMEDVVPVAPPARPFVDDLGSSFGTASFLEEEAGPGDGYSRAVPDADTVAPSFRLTTIGGR